MSNLKKFYFFRCTHCGQWYYSSKKIKTKKCWKCNHSFLFKNSTKFSKDCSPLGAIAIIKELKKKNENNKISNYFRSTNYSISRLKL